MFSVNLDRFYCRLIRQDSVPFASVFRAYLTGHCLFIENIISEPKDACKPMKPCIMLYSLRVNLNHSLD